MPQYETLTIKINADSKQANASLSRLKENLESLEKSAKTFDTRRVGEVRNLLMSIAKIDFSNVVRGLQDVVKAFNSINSMSNRAGKNGTQGQQLEGNYPVDYTYTTSTPPKNVKFDPPTNYLNTVKQIKVVTQEMVEEQNKYNEASKAFQALGFNAKQVQAIFNSINYETDRFDASQISALRQKLIDTGYSAEKADDIISRLNKDIGKIGDNAKKGTNGLKKLLNQFQKIMKYRIIRKIIQEIYKALTEGIKNVADFDTGLQESLSKLTSAFTFFKNSIGAVLSPIIQIIEPILSKITMLAGELNNTFAEIFAGANGQTTWAKATYDLKEYNKEAQKTQALGIDELNVLSQDNGAGGFTTEDVDLGKEENNLASSLKDIFDNIKKVLEPILTAVKDLVDRVLPAVSRLLKPISKIIGVIADLIVNLVEDTFEDVNQSNASFIDALASIFDFIARIVVDLAPTLKNVISIISSVLNVINSVLTFIFEAVGGIVNFITPLAHFLNQVLLPVLNVVLALVTSILAVVEGIVKSLVALVTFDWDKLDGIWKGIGNKINKAWQNIEVDMSSYATGGFPEDGFFFANHNELVGQFSNGQTAVANNAQITEGIYLAVRDAMRESGSAQDIVINLDGNELARVVTKKQNNYGADVVVGGNIIWGK